MPRRRVYVGGPPPADPRMPWLEVAAAPGPDAGETYAYELTERTVKRAYGDRVTIDATVQVTAATDAASYEACDLLLRILTDGNRRVLITTPGVGGTPARGVEVALVPGASAGSGHPAGDGTIVAESPDGLTRVVQVQVRSHATVQPDPGGDGTRRDRETETITTGPDGRVRVERSGTPRFGTIPTIEGPGRGTTETRVTTSRPSGDVEYSVTYQQIDPSLVALGEGVTGGSVTLSQETDHKTGETTGTLAWDLAGVATREAVLAAHLPAGAVVLAESSDATLAGGRGIRGSIRFAAAGTIVLDQSESQEATPDAAAYEVVTYPGATPVLVLRPQGVGTVIRSGTITARGGYVEPPALPADARLAEPPRVRYERQGAGAAPLYVTTWDYRLYASAAPPTGKPVAGGGDVTGPVLPETGGGL